ncbi:MAG: dihydroorotate dehydrogenase electron transfer subunit [Bacteroidales bacterium]|nr:dihydroorotate dehydrogenase electron transfer subunit [Bacteroidales bacterium]MDD3665733.1 dihydroorotate dehydrogenase electron transfer subunit [Bacteroidales bacterium]
MKKYIHDFEIIENREINEGHFVLVVKLSEPLPPVFPGQFAEVKIEGSPNTFLRRPLSIHDVDYAANTISLLVQRKGDGTTHLGTFKPGDTLNMVYPLGNQFHIGSAGEKVLLVGGGCGVAPLLYLGKILAKNGIKVTTLMGARKGDQLMEPEQYQRNGELLITTEDGSEGTKGFVIHHEIWRERNFAFDRVYTCGPDAMMKAVARLAARNNVPCQVSLEQTMACGVGACLCCVVDTTTGHRCTCTDGPVFDASELKNWID